ncbi:hypothetical protein G7062_11060 [Erysipelothrix sp. HDW6C]|uniref:hypothetical protein n=1 Tax=Erysipelothrix sp. HDW6C TaxID=2714930 RepID=UPI00140866F0|nr:hypothetical protein [Erysipelothrix sp. HDW6C]QIK70799.1 hypothetical protein G7062_11060 [Erysipelothrix sp. HDW6C]
MLKLMTLELKKKKSNPMIKLALNWLLVTGLCLGMVILIYNTDDLLSVLPSPGLSESMIQDTLQFQSFVGIKTISDAIIALAFIIYAGVNYGRFVVNDFASSRMELMYTYPVSRVKIMYAKIGVAAIVTCVSMILTKGVIYGFLAITVPSAHFTLINVLEIFTSAIAVTFMGQIAMAVGIWRKSVITTVVTAFLLAVFTQGNIGSVALYDFPIIPYIFAVIGVIVSYLFVARQKHYEFFN